MERVVEAEREAHHHQRHADLHRLEVGLQVEQLAEVGDDASLARDRTIDSVAGHDDDEDKF